MTYLPDVNLWIAFAHDHHIHHAIARDWVDSVPADNIVLCRVTEMGLLRLLTNKRVMSEEVFTATAAWRFLDRLRRDERVIFEEEPPLLEQAWRAMSTTGTGANFWTDTYLAAFAQIAGHTFVTFDRGFEQHTDLRLQILGRTDS